MCRSRRDVSNHDLNILFSDFVCSTAHLMSRSWSVLGNVATHTHTLTHTHTHTHTHTPHQTSCRRTNGSNKKIGAAIGSTNGGAAIGAAKAAGGRTASTGESTPWQSAAAATRPSANPTKRRAAPMDMFAAGPATAATASKEAAHRGSCKKTGMRLQCPHCKYVISLFVQVMLICTDQPSLNL